MSAAVLAAENRRWSPCRLGSRSESYVLSLVAVASDIRLLRRHRSYCYSIFSVIHESGLSISACMSRLGVTVVVAKAL
ncbi:uncharacterized protein DS421_3g88960 [Arachis hypogaea]|nr:uncharacterized protein DS421_3g88960 [Arachis hypogaea]